MGVIRALTEWINNPEVEKCLNLWEISGKSPCKCAKSTDLKHFSNENAMIYNDGNAVENFLLGKCNQIIFLIKKSTFAIEKFNSEHLVQVEGVATKIAVFRWQRIGFFFLYKTEYIFSLTGLCIYLQWKV